MNTPISKGNSDALISSDHSPISYFGLNIPFLDHLGVIPEFAEEGRSRISLDLKPEFTNSFQVAHGGLIMTLLDFAMAAATRSAAKHPLGVITIDMTTSFLRPSVGKIIVEGVVLKAGKTVNYCEAVVLNQDGEITAKSSGTFTLRR
jgi:uncharacterized protein (TIGR00369 family)